MKCRVDSKEFSLRVKQAARWTAKTGMEASECIILTAHDDFLILRTTTNDSDCVLAANAFDVERGMVITKAGILETFAWDTGGWLRISSGKKLSLDYESFGQPQIATVPDEIATEFPTLLDTEQVVSLSPEILIRAGSFTRPFIQTGQAIASAIHLIPAGEKIAVVGTDGFGGMRTFVPGTLNSYVSIEGVSALPALSVIPPPVNIGISEHRVEISNELNRIQFSTMACPDPSSFVAGFEYETLGSITLSSADFNRLAFLCERAASASQDARVRIGGSPVTVEIRGREVSIPEFVLCEGEIPSVVFACLGLSTSLKKVVQSEEYTISPQTHGGMIRSWYVDAKEDRYFMVIAADQDWDNE